MSRIVRKQLFSSWKFLEEAWQRMDGMVRDGRQEEIMELLADCQEEAIAMGSQIEAVYGDGLETVHCLEAYCESLYHITEHMDDVEDGTGYRALAGGQLTAVQEAMKKEIADRMEIAFFPCKASMWDCLASIYHAAVQGGNCEVYCISIPYYELEADGLYGEIRDERDGYPENVRMTGWQDYEFEVRKPDVIFIHDPYDGQGVAERVDERFYASNLRMYTENLVYVPYFLTNDTDVREDIRNSKAGVQAGTECFLPGVIYADKVIVHSERMRDRYMEKFTAEAEAKGMAVSRMALETKILALGSPRMDGIRDCGGRSGLIPEEWSRKIWKPDGQRKKVILYNTSINALLTDGMKLLDKMEQVFAVFREKREEVTLWWRPQALVKRMSEEMPLDLRSRYSGLVERYKEEGWGIFDDTEDEARALTVTDACYGDWSTIVWEYQNYAKPVMVQETNTINGTEKYMQPDYQVIRFWDFYKEGDEIWCSNTAFNGIFKINAQNGDSEYIGRLDRELKQEDLYWQVLPYHDLLVFFPEAGRYIVFLNKKTKEIQYAEIVNWATIWDDVRVACARIYGDKLWIFPRRTSWSVYYVDMKERRVGSRDFWKRWLPYTRELIVRQPYLGMATVMESGCSDEIWLPVVDTEKIVRCNPASEEAKIFTLQKPGCKINSIDASEDRLWITFADRAEIMEWNPATGQEISYLIDVEWDENRNPFSGIIPLSGSQCLILPAGTDKIILMKEKEWKQLEYPHGFCRTDNGMKDWTECHSYKREGDKVFICPSFGNMLLIYDTEKEMLEGKICTVPKGWSGENVVQEHIVPYFLQERISKKRMTEEKREGDLSHFLGCITGNYTGNGEPDYIGKKILDYIMENG